MEEDEDVVSVGGQRAKKKDVNVNVDMAVDVDGGWWMVDVNVSVRVSVPVYALMQLMSVLRMWGRGNVWARALRRQPNKRNENNLFSNFTI